MTGIADTGFVVGYVSRRDRWHDWAHDVAGGVSAPLFTCEAVLSEAVYLTGSASAVLGLFELGLLELRFDLGGELRRIQALAQSYDDRQPDLADLCLIRMSERYPTRPIFTVDEADFRVYRRNGREHIPLVTPRSRPTSRG